MREKKTWKTWNKKVCWKFRMYILLTRIIRGQCTCILAEAFLNLNLIDALSPLGTWFRIKDNVVSAVITNGAPERFRLDVLLPRESTSIIVASGSPLRFCEFLRPPSTTCTFSSSRQLFSPSPFAEKLFVFVVSSAALILKDESSDQWSTLLFLVGYTFWMGAFSFLFNASVVKLGEEC